MSMKPVPERPKPRSIYDEFHVAAAPSKEAYPWESPYVRTDIGKPVNVYISEADMLKMRYLLAHPIHEGSPQTMRAFYAAAMTEYIERQLKDRGIPEDRR
jgi:hypothetical protein